MTLQVKKNLQILALCLTIVTAVSGGWWTIDSTYARQEATIKTFSQMQQQIQQYKEDSIIDRLHATIMNLTERKFIIKDSLRKYPNDKDLQHEYISVCDNLDKAKARLEALEAK